MSLRKSRRPVYILLIVCLMATFEAIGQPEHPTGDPDTVPISGLEVLLGAGALLGLKKLLGNKKEDSLQR